MRVGWLLLLLFSILFSPLSLSALNFKDIVFPPAKATFVIAGEERGPDQVTTQTDVVDTQLHQAVSNHVKIVAKVTDLNQTSIDPQPSLLFYRYDPSSNFFVQIEGADYLSGERDSSRHFKKLPPLRLPNGDTIDIGKKIPIAKCLIYQKKEPIFIIYNDPTLHKEGVKVSISSHDDEEVILLKRIESNSSKYIGYINTTSACACKKRFDGKLFIKEGDELDASLYEPSTKRSTKQLRSLSSKVHAKAYVGQKPQRVAILDENQSHPAKVWIDMEASKERVGIGEFFKVTIALENSGDRDVMNMKLVNRLSSGATYIQKGFYLDDKKIQHGVMDRKHHRFSVTIPLKAHQRRTLSFVVRNESLTPEYLIDSSEVIYQNNRSNSAMIKVKRTDDFDERATIIGRVLLDENRSRGVEGVKLYLDNGRVAISDRYGKFHFGELDPALHLVSLDPSSIEGRYIAYECRANARSGGSALSKFVDTSAAHIGEIAFCVRENNITTSLKSELSYQIPKPKTITMPSYSVNSFSTLKKERVFLWPKEGAIPSMPAIKVAFLHHKSDKIALFVNGKKVNMLNFDGYVDSQDRQWTISKYRGIDLDDGDNLLEMVVKDKSGKEVRRVKRKVHFSTSPIKAVILPDRSYLVADGQNPPVIAVKMYDASGYPIRRGVTGTFQLSKPYLSLAKSKLYEDDPLLHSGEKNRYVIANDGIAYIELMPTTVTGEVKLHFEFQDQGRELTAWLKPKEKREWLLVGFAEGSVGYQAIKKHLQKSSSKEVIHKGGISLFAKGSVGKDTLLTIAYQSAKRRENPKRFIEEEVQNSRQFTVYADNSIDKNEAPTSKKLYLKIEKDQFYAMFGDFETGLDKLELSRYSRRLTGVKSEYRGEKFEYTAFASKNAGGVKRVEITPDGTSGPYPIKANAILPGSEKVYIEVRDRYRKELLLDKRGYDEVYDYSIDYQNGLLYFKAPIASRDRAGNPQTIIVEYEMDESQRDRIVAGGRGAIKFGTGGEIGASAMTQENRNDHYDTLYGIDFKMNLLKNLTLNGEYATSSKQTSNANAYLLRMQHFNQNIQTKAYFRHQERGFGLGLQNSALAGSNRYGIDSTISYFDNFLLRLSYYGENALQDKHKKETMESKLLFNRGGWLAMVGYRFAKDNMQTEDDVSQIISSVQKRFFHSKVGISLAYEKSLGERSDVKKDRTFGEISYRFTNALELFANHELLQGATKRDELSKVGIKGTAWKGATIQSGVSQKLENDEDRLYGFLGLSQYYQVNKKLSLNGAVEKQKSLNNKAIQKDYTSYSIGAHYKNKKWIYNGLFEYKDGFDRDKINLNFGIYTEVNKDLGVAMGIRESINDEVNSTKGYEGELKCSVAYRGERDYTLMSQLKLQHQHDRFGESQTLVTAIKGVVKPSKKSQISGHYALKIEKERIDDEPFTSKVDSLGVEAIYDMTKKFEVGANGSLLHMWESGNIRQSYGGYVGYNLFKNLYLGVGYNFQGYYDSDLSEYLDSAQGLYLKMRMKLDNESLHQLTKSF